MQAPVYDEPVTPVKRLGDSQELDLPETEPLPEQAEDEMSCFVG